MPRDAGYASGDGLREGRQAALARLDSSPDGAVIAVVVALVLVVFVVPFVIRLVRAKMKR